MLRSGAMATICAAALAGSLHSFGLDGGVILCVADRDLDPERMPVMPRSTQVPFFFGAADMRQEISGYSVDTGLERYRPASAFYGTVDLAGDTGAVATPPCRHEALSAGPYAGHELKSCERTVVLDGLRVTYRFQERNAALIPEFDRFLSAKIVEWRANCHATERL